MKRNGNGNYGNRAKLQKEADELKRKEAEAKQQLEQLENEKLVKQKEIFQDILHRLDLLKADYEAGKVKPVNLK